jgi:RNA polymerase sigma factor (sigma-70 family)
MAKSRSDCFARLFVERRSALKRYVQRFVGRPDAADEIVQEAFLRAYEHAASDRPVGPLLYSIARNLAVDHHRHQRLSVTEPLGLGEIPSSNVIKEGRTESLECWLLAEEQSALLKQAVEQLPQQCRAAFTLKVFHCCSYREIAKRLGIAEKTVEAHISRGTRETYRYLRRRYQLKDMEADRG